MAQKDLALVPPGGALAPTSRARDGGILPGAERRDDGPTAKPTKTPSEIVVAGKTYSIVDLERILPQLDGLVTRYQEDIEELGEALPTVRRIQDWPEVWQEKLAGVIEEFDKHASSGQSPAQVPTNRLAFVGPSDWTSARRVPVREFTLDESVSLAEIIVDQRNWTLDLFDQAQAALAQVQRAMGPMMERDRDQQAADALNAMGLDWEAAGIQAPITQTYIRYWRDEKSITDPVKFWQGQLPLAQRKPSPQPSPGGRGSDGGRKPPPGPTDGSSSDTFPWTVETLSNPDLMYQYYLDGKRPDNPAKVAGFLAFGKEEAEKRAAAEAAS